MQKRKKTSKPGTSVDETPSQDLNQYVTTDQAAEMLNVVPTSINHLIYNGKLKAIRLGRIWMVFLPSIENYRETKSKRGRPPSKSQ